MLFIFSMPVFIRHLWPHKTVVFMHWCLIRAVLLHSTKEPKTSNRAHISCQCRKTTVLSCHRCLINTAVEKMATFKFMSEL